MKHFKGINLTGTLRWSESSEYPGLQLSRLQPIRGLRKP